MKCTNCNNTIQDDNVFCPYCGHKVEKYKTCPNCGVEMAEDFNFCPKCGYDMQSKVYICPDCGNEVGAEYQFCSVCGRQKEDTVTNHNVKKLAGKKPKKVSSKKISEVISSDKMKLVQGIVFAVLAFMIFISSFFGVVRINVSDIEENNDLFVKFEKEIYYNATATNLIDLLFFSFGLDKEKATEYLESREVAEDKEKLDEITSDKSFIEVEGSRYVVNRKGCTQYQKALNNIDWLKIFYAEAVMVNEESGLSTMIQYKIAGVFSLCLIIVSYVAFVLSILGIVFKKDLGSIRLMAIMLAFVIITAGMFTTMSGNFKWTMGVAFIFITIFSVLYILFRSVLHWLGEKKINLQGIMLKATGVVMGIILVCLFSASAIRVTIPYKDETIINNPKDIEYQYEFNQADLFDQYYFADNKDTDYTMEDLMYYINEYAPNFVNRPSRGDEYFKTNIGLQMILQTRQVQKTNQAVLAILRIQPVLFLVSLISAVTFLVYSIVGLSGAKTSGLSMIIMLIVLLIGIVFSILCPLLLNALISIFNQVDIQVGVGSGVIAQAIFFVISIVLIACSKLLKGKELFLGKKQKYSNNTTDFAKQSNIAENTNSNTFADMATEQATAGTVDNSAEQSSIVGEHDELF